MASLAKITLQIAILSIFFSQLWKYSFDVALVIAAIANFLSLFISRQIKVKNTWFLLFLGYASINLLVNQIFSSWSPLPGLYLIRLIALISFFVFPPIIDLTSQKLITTVLIATVFFGIIQYIFWPDLTFFNSLNWDPHLNRIVGPFFDPTFTALIYLFLLITLTLQANLLLLVVYSALALTYSRSTLISMLLITIIATIKTKKLYILIVTLTILSATIILLPQPYGEGTKLNRTSTIFAKIENYKIAFSYIKSAPIFGVGYNRLPLIRTDQKPASHAVSAFDNSLLTIWATTGIFGLVLFLGGIITELRHRSWTKNLYWFSVLFHSFFANSLLYPPILFLLALL